MKKQFLLLFILIITVFIIPSFFTQVIAASDEPYEMQKVVKLDKKLDVVYNTTRKYYNSGSQQLIEKTKSNYGYNDLANRSNSSGRLNFYDQLYTMYSGIYGTDQTFNSTKGYYVIGEVDINTYGLTIKEAVDTYFIFRHDNPILYYSSNSFICSGTTVYVTIFEDYASGEVRQEYETSIASAINEYEDATEECSDNYNKILAVHDYLCENMTYVLSGKVYEHNIIGALIENKGVCESYARTFELILNYLEIENVFVAGVGNNGYTSEPHAWNLVKLGNYYYWVDCTWDDNDPIKYTYFMKGNLSWSDHTANTPETEDFLYDLPNTIANISISYQAIEVFKNGNSIGKLNSSQEAFNAILVQNDANAKYELVFDNKEREYFLPSGQWPEADNIKITSSPIILQEGGQVTVSIMLYDDVTLNSDLAISDIYLVTESDIYSQNDHSCLNLNIGSHTIEFAGKTTHIGGTARTEYIPVNGVYEVHDYDRLGLNIIGTEGSSIKCDTDAYIGIDGDRLIVDEIRGIFLQFNVGKAEIGNIYCQDVSFRQDYDVEIDNLYVLNFSLGTQSPSNYNSTGIRKVNIGNLYRYLENYIPSFNFYSMKEEDVATWPTINLTGNINAGFKIAIGKNWTPSEGFKMLNIGNNSINTLLVVTKQTVGDITNNFYVNQSGDILTCYHNGETEVIEAHEATCTEDGNTEGVRCLVCGNVISGNEVIQAKGHKYETVVTPATLSEDGKIEDVCTECGDRKLISTLYSPTLFTLSSESYTYNGNVQKPTVIIKDSQGNQISSDYYDVTYIGDCINQGTYTVNVIFKGNYNGTKELTYKINAKSILFAGVTGIEDKVYTGDAINQNVSVIDGNVVLQEGTDYTVEYHNNTNQGMATIIITGIGNYTGSREESFSINPKSISLVEVTGIEDKVYTGDAINQNVSVIDGNVVLQEGTDYIIGYDNNINKGIATIIITGMGNYTGNKENSFSINAKSISLADVTGIIEDEVYTGNSITQNIIVTDGYRMLQEGTDYTVEYSNNINAGCVTLTINGIGNYSGTKTLTYNIKSKTISELTILGISDKNYTGGSIKQSITLIDGEKVLKDGRDYTVEYSNNIDVGTATLTINGKGNYTGTKKLTFKINAKSLSKFTVSGISDKNYTGGSIKQNLTIKDGTKILKEGIDYTVCYKDNKNAGTATLTITGKGNYKDSLKKTFKINPKGTNISKLSALSKGFIAKWSKQSSETSGYEIEYATDSKFTKNEKKITVSGKANTSKKVTKLKSKKKYYIRVRTYKTVNGKKYYSSWSKVKYITTKK